MCGKIFVDVINNFTQNNFDKYICTYKASLVCHFTETCNTLFNSLSQGQTWGGGCGDTTVGVAIVLWETKIMLLQEILSVL